MSTFFQVSTEFVPENGSAISPWDHNWGRGLLRMELPNLFSHASDVSISLRQATLAQPLTAIFRPTLSPAAQQELYNLQQQLSHLILTADGLDNIRWRWSASGHYTVRSSYMALKSGSIVQNDVTRIWILQTPPRIKIFGWLMLSNKLLAQDNLSRKGWAMVSVCVMCRSNVETAKHLFGECPYTTSVYGKLRTSGMSHDSPQDLNIDPTTAIAVKRFTDAQRSAILIMQFIIWREWCSRIFRNTIKEPSELIAVLYNIKALVKSPG